MMHINKKQKLHLLRNSNKIPVAPLQYYNNIGCIYYLFTSVPQLPWSRPTLSTPLIWGSDAQFEYLLVSSIYYSQIRKMRRAFVFCRILGVILPFLFHRNYFLTLLKSYFLHIQFTVVISCTFNMRCCARNRSTEGTDLKSKKKRPL